MSTFIAVEWTCVNCSVSQNFTLKTWVLPGFRFYWSVFYNQAIYRVLAAVLRDCIGKYTEACCSLPVSYFEQVLEEEQLSVTGQNKPPLTLPHTLSLFINFFFHFREFIWAAISDHHQTAQWFILSFPLWDACVPSTYRVCCLGTTGINLGTHSTSDPAAGPLLPWSTTSRDQTPYVLVMLNHLMTGFLATGGRSFAYFSSWSRRAPISCSSEWYCKRRDGNSLCRALISMNVPKRHYFFFLSEHSTRLVFTEMETRMLVLVFSVWHFSICLVEYVGWNIAFCGIINCNVNITDNPCNWSPWGP